MIGESLLLIEGRWVMCRYSVVGEGLELGV